MNEWKQCPKCKCMNKNRTGCVDCGRDLEGEAPDKPLAWQTADDKPGCAPVTCSAPTVIFHCDCADFRKGVGIWFDDQDAREYGWTKCPACKKPFLAEAQNARVERPERITPAAQEKGKI